MSIRQILQVWEHAFSHPHQAVMLALADHAHEDGTGIRPSINRIAWKTGYSERSVQNIMAQLRQLGVLVIAVPATHKMPNEYRFNWSAATPKPSFDAFISQKKGQKNVQKKGKKGGGANSAPLSKAVNRDDNRGAVPVRQGCSSDAAGVQLPCNRGAVPVQEGCSPLHPIRNESSREPSIKTKEPKAAIFKFGVVTYQHPPDEIDLVDLWETNPGKAKRELRIMAPGHKRPDMVAHGFGQWWVGPGLNDFDEHLIKACQQRKRKFQQPDSVGDSKTFINNMLRNEDWGNFALRCEEAQVLRERAAVVPVARPAVERETGRSPFERSTAERQASALGLARFKVGRGEIKQAKALARQFGLALADIGLAADGMIRGSLSARAA